MGENLKKVIVISAINFRNGGPLSILEDCIEYLEKNLVDKYEVYALVHDKKLFKNTKKIYFIEFGNSINSYFYRLYYEYFYFKKLSVKLNPYLWFSLHDMTPNVKAIVRAVYCHNPSPFYKVKVKEFFLDPKFTLFSWLYKWIYKINIHKNHFVVVQQEWLKDEFKRMFTIKDCIVAHPHIAQDKCSPPAKSFAEKQFFYPTFPRVFKNIEVICEAISLLETKYQDECKVLLTIDGTENKYAEWIVNKYKNIKNIKFIGLQSREDIFKLYGSTDCLIFPSKLETWGMPISEFQAFNKPMIIADVEYAHETVGDYEKVKFFNPVDAKILSHTMQEFLNGSLIYDGNNAVKHDNLFAQTWEELFDILLKVNKQHEQ